MPNALFALDTMFPQLKGSMTDGQKISAIYDYLFQVQESLRYTLTNLSGDNFNDTELALLGQTIREPLTVSIQGVEGELTYLRADQEGLASRLKDAEGRVAEFELTAEGLDGRLEDAEGNILELGLTAAGFDSRMEDAEGRVGDLESSAETFSNRLKDTEGNVSKLQQWADGFSFEVSNGEKASTLTLKSGTAKLASAEIRLTGMVTFADLKDEGTTVINGSNITTGKISALVIEGCTWKSESKLGYGVRIQENRQDFLLGELTVAQLYMNTEGWFGIYTSGGYSMNIDSSKKLKLLAGSGMSLDAVETIYIGASDGYKTTVGIGNEDSTVYLRGNVYLNGVLLSAS